MKGRLTPICLIRDERADEVIKKLEAMLEIARSEPQASVLVQMVGRDGQHRTIFGSRNVTEQVGLLEIAKHNLIQLPGDD